MTEPRKLKRGQIFLNLWAGWQSLFVYLRTQKDLCYGVGITKVNGKYKVRNVQYYKHDLQNDAEHFPLMGEIDINEMWLSTVLENISLRYKLIYQNYDEMGHMIVGGEVAEWET